MIKSIIKLVISLLFIAGLAALAVFGVRVGDWRLPSAFDEDYGIRKGFDLTGGSVIVYEAAQSAPTDAQMDSVVGLMYKRLSRIGLTEATAARQGKNRVVIEIPSITNPDEAIKTLGATAELKFVDADGGVILTGKDVTNAVQKYGRTKENGPEEHYVELTFNNDAVAKFAEATEKASTRAGEQKNYIAIQLDEEVFSQPRVSERIDSQTCIISGSFTAETAKDLADTIKEGQLPFKLNVVERRSAGPILGDNALNTSLQAGMIGLLLVMLFMILFYRLPGLVSAFALIGYVSIVALVLGYNRINLSLPGIAGIILSIGMAVDANVIIFERVKEELNLGKSFGASLEAGFKRAMVAIIDGNITTLIAAVVLMYFGTGPIKGFAVTLFIGIIVSMFSAIIVTRFMLGSVFGLNIKNPALYGSSVKGGN